ncbi:MAG TPA: amidase family protein, partial [Geminicoccaceae bacterium]|nr:amidase family protein [Geminicoccaceae bacterium]
ETAGLRTTYGSPIYRDHVPDQDERIVADIRAAGGIVLAKTNTPEFGAGANTTNAVYGPTGNPFDPARTCGGSSGGSAVALATSMLPLCTGSDLGGSLRTPAAYCGVVGFRPSPGLVPHELRVHGWGPLPVQGPMGRDVADTRLLLSVMAADDPRDPLARPVDGAAFREGRPVDLAGLRAAWSVDLGFATIDRRIAETFRARIGAIAPAFKSCAEAELPDMGGAGEAFAVLRAVGFVGAHRERYERRRDLLGPNVAANVEQGLGLSLADVARALAEQTRIYRGFQRLFEDIDLLIAPTAAVPPFPHGQPYVGEIDGRPMPTYFHWLAPVYGLTLTTHPVAALPCGLDPTGTPFGLQLCGPRGGDRFVLDAAAALEAYLAAEPALARPLPDLAALRDGS